MNQGTNKHRKSTGIIVLILIILIAISGAILTYIIKNSGNTLNSGTIFSENSAEKTIQNYADKNGIDYNEYPQQLISLLERNIETKDFVLSYPTEYNQEHNLDMSEYENCDAIPLFMQWDKRWGYIKYSGDVAGLTGCGPVCLSMAAYYLTKDSDMSPDKIIEFAKKNGYALNGITEKGSSWKLISEGGIELGFDVTEIPLDENRIVKNLEVGNPIICSMGPGDFTSTGHFIVLTGYKDGKISVNDPNSHKNSEKLWSYEDIKDQIMNLWVIRNK
ncbi:MAG: peptidase C39 family protein [Eubacterium sp.]|nr:peptidase C39 family protein [Eubacterium sp.]